MISVIMPTMWKPEGVLERVKLIVEHPSVFELILIDNSDTPPDLGFIKKVKHIKEGKNTFVNPAWNKGYEIAFSTIDKLCFLNDDVITDWDIFDKMDYEGVISEDKGMIGAMPSCWQGFNTSPGVHSTNTMPNCYGCLFFIHRKSYTPIPEDLLVHYGDNWLFEKSGKQNYGINAWPMGGESEQTSGLAEFNAVKLVDKHNWMNKYR